MNKKVLIAFVSVFILLEVLSFIMNGIIMAQAYETLQNVWRPDMQRLWWVFQVVMLIGAFFFSFVFSKGYEGKGLVEGARYGLYIGIWQGVGFAYGTYAMVAIPYSMALAWFIYSIVEHVLAGIVAAAIFGKTAMVTAVKTAS
jgi:hypothetical protein